MHKGLLFFENMVGGGGKKRAKKKWEQEDKPTIGGTIYLETKFWKEMMDKWQEQKRLQKTKQKNGGKLN